MNVFKFLNTVTELCCQHGKTFDDVEVPTVMVVGSQSSGKTSTIENIIGHKILPKGNNMVTRNPTHIRLHYANQPTVKITLSVPREDSTRTKIEEIKSINFKPGDPNEMEKLREIGEAIVRTTDELTQGKYNISNIPMFIDVYSPIVSNFSFVDLPGLVATASTDKGQPSDLPEKIKALVKSELMKPNTIALVIVRSGNDLVTDLGVALVNEVRSQLGTNNGFSTIGVLTKPDLLDKNWRDNLNFLIAGKVIGSEEPLSQNEMMSEGWFVVNNTCENLEAEKQYFIANFENSREIMTKKRYCIGYLKLHLQSHLHSAAIKLMPEIRNKLLEISKGQRQRLQYLGTKLESEKEKTSYLMSTIFELNRLICDAIKDTGNTGQNVGPKIKIAQDAFLRKITQLAPFSPTNISDEYFKTIISEFEGYHLTAHVSLEQLVDKCIKDPKRRPVLAINEISKEFTQAVISVLNDVISQLLKSDTLINLGSYPRLKNRLYLNLTDTIKKYCKIVNDEIIDFLETEESFVWSTDSKFRETLKIHFLPRSTEEEKRVEKSGFISSSSIKTAAAYNTLTEKNTSFHYSYEPSQVRALASDYYTTIVERARDKIVKTVYRKITNRLAEKAATELNVFCSQTDQSLTGLITEDPTTARERETLVNNIERLEDLINQANNLDA